MCLFVYVIFFQTINKNINRVDIRPFKKYKLLIFLYTRNVFKNLLQKCYNILTLLNVKKICFFTLEGWFTI